MPCDGKAPCRTSPDSFLHVRAPVAADPARDCDPQAICHRPQSCQVVRQTTPLFAPALALLSYRNAVSCFASGSASRLLMTKSAGDRMLQFVQHDTSFELATARLGRLQLISLGVGLGQELLGADLP